MENRGVLEGGAGAAMVIHGGARAIPMEHKEERQKWDNGAPKEGIRERREGGQEGAILAPKGRRA